MSEDKPASFEMRLAFGQTLRDFRTEAGMTLGELAAATGVTLSYISELERGQHNLGMDTMTVLAKALGKRITVEWSDLPRPARRKRA